MPDVDVVQELHAEFDKAAAPATPEPPAPEPPQKPRFGLDDVILDDERLPQSLRGQTAFQIAEERRKAITETQGLASERNRLKAENEALERAYRGVLERFGTAPAAPVVPEASPTQRLRERISQDTTGAWNDPAATFAAAAEAGAEEAEARFRPQLETAAERIAKLEQKSAQDAEKERNQNIFSIYQSVRPEEIPQKFWNGKFNQYAASFAIHNQLPLDDPQTYRAALDDYRQTFAEFNPAAKPETDTPATPAPVAPAPPVGGGRPAAPPTSKPTAHLNNHDRAAMAKITAIFKEKTGMTASADDIMGDLKSDPKTRNAFP